MDDADERRAGSPASRARAGALSRLLGVLVLVIGIGLTIALAAATHAALVGIP